MHELIKTAVSHETEHRIMQIAANTIPDLCDGTPGALDAVVQLRQYIERQTAEFGVDLSEESRAMLSAATHLAKVGARILHIDPPRSMAVITIDPKHLHFLSRPELHMVYLGHMQLDGAAVQWFFPIPIMTAIPPA